MGSEIRIGVLFFFMAVKAYDNPLSFVGSGICIRGSPEGWGGGRALSVEWVLTASGMCKNVSGPFRFAIEGMFFGGAQKGPTDSHNPVH